MLESIYGATKRKPSAMPAPPGGPSPLAAYLQKTANPVSDLLNSNRVAQANQPVGPAPHTIADNSAASSTTAAANVEKAKTQAASGGVGPSMPKVDFNTDYSSDPVLMKMLAGGAADEASADTSALTARRGVVSQLGDRNLASQVLGAGDPTLDSISDNPDTSTSTFARLKRAYGSTVKQNEDALNENNLWYGGQHGKVLGDLSKDFQTQTADASSQAQAALDQIAAGLASTKQGLRDKQASAESAAADRKAQQLLAEIIAGAGQGGTTPPPADQTPPPADGGVAAPDVAGTAPYWDPVKQIWVNAAARNQSYGLGA